MRTFSELSKIETFEERYRYLRIGGKVGEETFGIDRWLNQLFYKDSEWLSVRNFIIVRDGGCDLGISGRDIRGSIFVHHINPINKSDILHRDPKLFDPENLICTSKNTHDAIHYGDESLLIPPPIVRYANDMCPWRHR